MSMRSNPVGPYLHKFNKTWKKARPSSGMGGGHVYNGEYTQVQRKSSVKKFASRDTFANEKVLRDVNDVTHGVLPHLCVCTDLGVVAVL